MSATIPVPPLPQKTVSSDPLQDELTSYAPPTLTKRTGHSLHKKPYFKFQAKILKNVGCETFC